MPPPNNQGFILDGIFKEQVHNWGTISGGIFQGEVHNWGTISGGTFEEVVEMNESPEGAKIEGGTFKKGIELNAYFPTITIKDGLFDGEVSAAEGYSGTLSISGGYFVNKPSLPVGSDTRFTTVSDQSYRTFQVPVNGDWSESGYNKLYVPNGSPAQPNTITVKTHTKLLYYLADGEQFPVPDSDSDSYVYKIPVQNYEKDRSGDRGAFGTPNGRPPASLTRRSPPAQPHLASCWALRVWVISPMLTSLPCTCTIPCRAALSPPPGRSWQTSCGRLPASPTL